MRPLLILPFVCSLILAGCAADRSGPAAAVTPNVQAASEEQERARSADIGAMERVTGTRLLTASLRLPGPASMGRRGLASSYEGVSGRGEYRQARHLNQLFYDLDTRAARWLFETNGQRILEMTALERGTEKPVVRAYLYRVAPVEPPPEGEEKGTAGVHLALSAADGTGYTVVAEQVDEVLGRFPVDDSRMVIWYRSADSVAGVEVDLDKPSVLHRTLLTVPAALNATEA